MFVNNEQVINILNRIYILHTKRIINHNIITLCARTIQRLECPARLAQGPNAFGRPRKIRGDRSLPYKVDALPCQTQ
jgi:hypothetical protein